MSIDFSVDPELVEQLDWVRGFVATEIEPIDLAWPAADAPWDLSLPVYDDVVRPLQLEVRERGLWAWHLPPELGGQGRGQVELALLNEILGRSHWAPVVFGTQSPDSGNAEILARYGTDEQKERFLDPLLAGSIGSSFAMTEPQGGSDPARFTCRAHMKHDEWVIDGEKWFAANFAHASFVIVMVVTNPDVSVYTGSSMLLVPKGTPGMELVRPVGLFSEAPGQGSYGYLRFDHCRIPADHCLGEPGHGFEIAQSRLGRGRIHHAMRAVGQCAQALEMMLERAASRTTRGSLLGDKQAVQHAIADSWIQLQQFRLQTLHAAWTVDQSGARAARAEIAGVEAALPTVVADITQRAMHLHGALGVSNEMPFGSMVTAAAILGLLDGPTEVHKSSLARALLKETEPSATGWPSEHLPERTAAARERFADLLEREQADR